MLRCAALSWERVEFWFGFFFVFLAVFRVAFFSQRVAHDCSLGIHRHYITEDSLPRTAKYTCVRLSFDDRIQKLDIFAS